MKLNLNQYATEWVEAAGRQLDGITNDEIMAEVNTNLTQYDEDSREEIEREPITLDEADTIRRVIEDYLSR